MNVLGSVMVGPSSSHTAGTVRIGNVARILLGREPIETDITFYSSFVRTYRGHGTDKAILAGITGVDTDDTRIRMQKIEGFPTDFVRDMEWRSILIPPTSDWRIVRRNADRKDA